MPDLVKCPNCGRRNRVPAAVAGTSRCGNCHKPLPWIVDAGDDDFTEAAERASVPALIDLWAPWCGPCRLGSPPLEQLPTEMARRRKPVKVTVGEPPRRQQPFAVRARTTPLELS